MRNVSHYCVRAETLLFKYWTVRTVVHDCSVIVETSCTEHSWYLAVYTIIHRCGFIADTSYFLRSQYQYCINNTALCRGCSRDCHDLIVGRVVILGL